MHQNGKTGIGFIGLGAMGAPMARNLLIDQPGLCVHDIRDDAVSELSGAGAVACSSPAEMATRCGTILLCLPSTPQIRDVMFGTDGLASAAASDLTVLDTSTLDRSDALDVAAKADQAGIAYWDCPVTGGLPGARTGALTAMFGGTKPAFNTAKPLLESFSTEVIHCGPVGSGQAMKALNNIIYNINIVALCEVLPLAVAAGLDAQAVARAVTTGTARSFASQHFVPRMLDRQFDTDYSLENAYKDIGNVRRMAQDHGASLPLVDAMTASYEAAMAAGHADEPKSAIIKIYERALGAHFGRT